MKRITLIRPLGPRHCQSWGLLCLGLRLARDGGQGGQDADRGDHRHQRCQRVRVPSPEMSRSGADEVHHRLHERSLPYLVQATSHCQQSKVQYCRPLQIFTGQNTGFSEFSTTSRSPSWRTEWQRILFFTGSSLHSSRHLLTNICISGAIWAPCTRRSGGRCCPIVSGECTCSVTFPPARPF